MVKRLVGRRARCAKEIPWLPTAPCGAYSEQPIVRDSQERATVETRLYGPGWKRGYAARSNRASCERGDAMCSVLVFSAGAMADNVKTVA